MGSLVPGWDTVDRIQPQDEGIPSDDSQAEKGYFARYYEKKELRRRSNDAPAAAADQRGALRSISMKASSESAKVYQRISSLTREAEFPSSPTIKAVGGTGKSTGDQEQKWWRRFSSAALNEMEEPSSDKSSAYVPQYSLTGQKMNYTVPDKEAALINPNF